MDQPSRPRGRAAESEGTARSKRTPLLGAVLLRAYIDRAHHGAAYDFAKASGIPCDQVLKVLRSDRQRIAVDLALDFAAATSGEVPVTSWRMRPPPAPLRDNRPVEMGSEAATRTQAA